MIAVSLVRTVREIGLNPRRLRLSVQFPRFLRDLMRWKRLGGRISSVFPVLSDWSDQAGDVSGAYFHQDMLVARRIFEARPLRHIDVGSRFDGFVAHVAVFREIDVVDIRPMQSSIQNVRFIQANIMQRPDTLLASTDSLSCLHALEHFGLGRYGDPIDPLGHLKGFKSLIDMLKPGATFYLSFPIGRPMVEFNAHRVFDCEEVFSWPGSESLQLERFDYVDDRGTLHDNIVIHEINVQCAHLKQGCGIYTFTRRG
jgi:Caenorhabditis protein of unknown function, DUF268